MNDVVITLAAYASLVVLFLLMSTGLAASVLGIGALPEVVRRYQSRFGWPGNELAPSGPRRLAGLAFGASLLLLDSIALVGLLATDIASARATWLGVLAEFAVPTIWSIILLRSIARHRRGLA